MRRRTLDILFSSGALVLSGLLVVLGLVLVSNASFAKDYVGDQLTNEELTFKTADKLTPAEKAWTSDRTNCLVTFAGQRVTSGKQAECWANEYIGGHLKDPTRSAKGLSYAALGTVQGDLRDQIATAEAAKDPALPSLQQQLDDVTAARDTTFKGEMLRNALLTSYGFSVLGDKAGLAASVLFVLAAVVLLLAIAGFVHAYRTPKTQAFAPVEVSPRVPVAT